MVYFIKFPRLGASYQNYLSSEQRTMLSIRNRILGCGVSNLLLYKKKLPKDIREDVSSKRGIKSISIIDPNRIDQSSIMILHTEIIDNISNIVKFSIENDRMLFIPYDSDTNWDDDTKIVDVKRYRGGKNRIKSEDSPLNISRNNISFISDIKDLDREFKLLYLLN